MNIEVKDHIIIFNIKPLTTDFEEKLITLWTSYQDKNIILNLSNLNSTETSKINLLKKVSNQHKENDKSFVIVSKFIVDEAEELDIVPTQQEALDYIEMEDIQRDLDIDL